MVRIVIHNDGIDQLITMMSGTLGLYGELKFGNLEALILNRGQIQLGLLQVGSIFQNHDDDVIHKLYLFVEPYLDRSPTLCVCTTHITICRYLHRDVTTIR